MRITCPRMTTIAAINAVLATGSRPTFLSEVGEIDVDSPFDKPGTRSCRVRARDNSGMGNHFSCILVYKKENPHQGFPIAVVFVGIDIEPTAMTPPGWILYECLFTPEGIRAKKLPKLPFRDEFWEALKSD